MRAALLADLVEWALSRDPGSDVGVRVECTYSVGWELDEASGRVLTVEISETPCMPEWGEVD